MRELTRPRIIFLGTGASTPTPNRWVSGVLIEGVGITMLMDAGEGVQIRLREVGVEPAQLDLIAITHLHGDHVFGLMPLLQSVAMRIESMKIKRSVVLVGPQGVDYLARAAIGSFDKDYLTIDVRLIEDPRSSVVVVDGNTVVPLPIAHGDVRSWGYYVKLRVSGGRYVRVFYGADGVPEEFTIEFLKRNGVDVLIHEATYSRVHSAEALRTGHATSDTVARMAVSVNPQVVILTHISQRYGSYVPQLDEVRTRFKRVYLAEDLMTYPIYILPREELDVSGDVLFP